MNGEYIGEALPIEPDFKIPENHDFKYSVEELDRRLGQCSYEYSEATRRMRKIQVTKNIQTKKVRIILLSWSVHLLRNEKLREHVKLLQADPKYKWIKEDLEACIFVELESVVAEYERYEAIAKQAEKEHGMWNAMLINRMSERKHEGRTAFGDGGT